MGKKAITWGVRLGSISLAVGLAAYMSAQEAQQQGVSVNTNTQQNQNSTSSQQDDTLTPKNGSSQDDTLSSQNGQTDDTQQFGGRHGRYRMDQFDDQGSQSDTQSGSNSQDDQIDGNSQDSQIDGNSQFSDNSQNDGSIQGQTGGFHTQTGGS